MHLKYIIYQRTVDLRDKINQLSYSSDDVIIRTKFNDFLTALTADAGFASNNRECAYEQAVRNNGETLVVPVGFVTPPTITTVPIVSP